MMITLSIFNLVGSMIAGFAALYLGQQWLADSHTPRILGELHRALLFTLTCLLIWHAVDPSFFNEVLVIWGIGALWVVRIIARTVTSHSWPGWSNRSLIDG